MARRRQWILNTSATAGLLGAIHPSAWSAEKAVAKKVVAGAAVAADVDDIKDSLIKIYDNSLLGIGFITRMEGKSFIVTTASVVAGHNKLTFKTVGGAELKPRKIELSATRDLVRFLVGAPNALTLAAPEVGDNISVLKVGASGGVEKYKGRVKGLGGGMIKLDADFDRECRGSPLLNVGDSVGGVASHLVLYKAIGRAWEGTGRSFAYTLDDAGWYAANWKGYNQTYGKKLRDADKFRANVYTVAAQWIQEPQEVIKTEVRVNLDFERWVKAHNGMISDLEAKRRDKDSAAQNKKLQDRFVKSCDELARICRRKADQLWFLTEDKKTTKYLRTQFKWRSLELKKFCAFLVLHKKWHADDRWV